jgi:D-alanyl-D-alanine dipeptidase
MLHRFEIKKIFTRVSFILPTWAIITFFLSQTAISQETAGIEGNLALVKVEKEMAEISVFERQLMKEGLINVGLLDPTLMVDLKYAREDNFMGLNVYGDFKCAYLQPEAAWKLVRASQILRERHPELRILVGDAFRPRSVQYMMWKLVEATPMQPYVANPESGSMHNYGAAVDVTLFNVKTGKQLDMGTPFDYFGPLAQPRLEARFLREGKLSQGQIENRLILRNAMVDSGWYPINIEWWHFNAFPRDYIRRNYSIIE